MAGESIHLLCRNRLSALRYLNRQRKTATCTRRAGWHTQKELTYVRTRVDGTMPGENSGKFDTSVDEGVRKTLRIDERHDRVDGVSRRDSRRGRTLLWIRSLLQ